jgi:hypothetical protein
MPETITCPKCRSVLRLPANFAGKKVKCPSCATVFAPPGSSALPDVEEDFEVVDEDESRTAPRRPSRPARREEHDEPPPRPRARSRREEEDDDYDRPRRRRRDFDDEDDDYDRPRGRRGRDDDYDDDYDDDPERRERQRARARVGQLRRASLGLLLNFIAACLYMGALAVLFLLGFLGILGTGISSDVLILAGLPGMANWIVAGVGFGFCLAGPRKHGALGLAIATAAVAAVHLILVIVSAFEDPGLDVQGFGRVAIQRDVDWSNMVTHLKYLAGFANAVQVRIDWIALMASLLELARLILALLYVRALVLSVKEHSLSRNALAAVIAVSSAMGALILINLFFGLIFKGGIKSVGAARAILILSLCINFFTMIGMVAWYSLVMYLGRQAVRR